MDKLCFCKVVNISPDADFDLTGVAETLASIGKVERRGVAEKSSSCP